MCALPEYNSIVPNQDQLSDNAVLNMTLMNSSNCTSDRFSYDCSYTNNKMSKSVEEPGSTSMNSTNVSGDAPNVFEKTQNLSDKKSLYMSKACKYSFIASDYTSPEGQKLLNIKVYQKPPETDPSNLKGKNFLSKRSISEYFLSKNVPEKDNQDERGKESSLLKSWQRTFFKPQIVMAHHAEEHPNCDMNNTSLQGSRRESILNSMAMSDLAHPSHRSSYSLQQQLPTAFLDAEPGTSDFIEDKTTQSGALDDKYNHKSNNLNPNVNFKVFDIESLSEAGEPCESGSQENNVHFGLDEAWFIPSARHTFSGADISGSASAAQLSIASSFGDSSLPTCKICHTAAKPEDPLISPCRCTGTLRYIHCGCLMKWLEICNKRSRKPPTCELCKYQFHWHKKFKVGHWQFPHCSWQDKILHTVFLISVLIMIGCAVVTVMCFKQHRGAKAEISHLELTQSEIITLICGALFFLAFFLAMYVEIKARNTIYKLMLKFIYLNQQWYIDEYDKKKENSAIDV
ncbi:RING-CH-type domain-containing protein [Nephila pilipes]|uniref:RING-CH-type domain-containing protein n=1 Tax=Nephila pilipes TaxID=299642 RepID=A0A8X6NT47_NEPPI|nr:RING-CH-type domain-containing protein [Nephila pilipes]